MTALQQKGNARQSVSLEEVLLFAVEHCSTTQAYAMFLTHRLYKRNQLGHRMAEVTDTCRFYNAFAHHAEHLHSAKGN